MRRVKNLQPVHCHLKPVASSSLAIATIKCKPIQKQLKVFVQKICKQIHWLKFARSLKILVIADQLLRRLELVPHMWHLAQSLFCAPPTAIILRDALYVWFTWTLLCFLLQIGVVRLRVSSACGGTKSSSNLFIRGKHQSALIAPLSMKTDDFFECQPLENHLACAID